MLHLGAFLTENVEHLKLLTHSYIGISLFSTDKNTTIRWVDVNMVRSRKLKDRATIEALDDESSDIFFPSWVDSYYPNRAEELEDMHLYDFLAWHDWERKEPSKSTMYYPFMGGFLKKRTAHICLITTNTVSVKNQRNTTTHYCFFSNHGGTVKVYWVVVKHMLKHFIPSQLNLQML